MGTHMSQMLGELDFEYVRSQFMARPCYATAIAYHNIVSDLWSLGALDELHIRLMSRETLAWSLRAQAQHKRQLPTIPLSVVWWDMCITIESAHAIVAIYCGTCVVRGETIHIAEPVDLRGYL